MTLAAVGLDEEDIGLLSEVERLWLIFAFPAKVFWPTANNTNNRNSKINKLAQENHILNEPSAAENML